MTVVVATRNRRASLMRSLAELSALPEAPRVVVVDNGSTDGTPDAVRVDHPAVTVVEAGRNLGAAGRTLGARLAATRYVAFGDDDSWWTPGALARAVGILEARPGLALLAARVLVGEDGEEDPVCAAMGASPLPRRPGAPGPTVLGFVACGAIVRRDAFLSVGGFHPRLGIGGEEALLALDLARGGWELAYVPAVVVRHHPSPVRDAAARRRLQERNRLLVSWLRRRPGTVAAATVRLVRRAATEPEARGALVDALRGLSWALPARRPVGRELEAHLRLLERA